MILKIEKGSNIFMIKSKVVIKTRSNSKIIIIKSFVDMASYFKSISYLVHLFENESIAFYSFDKQKNKYVLDLFDDDFFSDEFRCTA